MQEIDKLKKNRQSVRTALTRIYTFCVSENVADDEVKVRALRADELFKEFEQIQRNIELLTKDDGLPEEERYRSEVEHKYFAIKTIYLRLTEDSERNTTIIEGQSTTTTNELPSAIQALITHQGTMGTLLERFVESSRSEQTFSPNQNNNSSSGELRLPRIKIPEFDGTSRHWIRFRDLFEAMVHSKTTISAAEKLEYLQTLLKGEALSLTSHLALTSENYDVAWGIIKKRYDNSDKVKKSYFELLIDQPRLKTTSFNEMKQFVNNINEGYNALKVLNEPVEHWNSILLYILEKKLDDETATLWFREKLSNSTTSSFKLLLNFLEKRVLELENTHKLDPRKRNPVRAFATTVVTCPVCSEDHQLFNCSQFKEMDIENRRQIVRQHYICYNCLQPNHRASECKRSSCRKCDKKHNTLLHFTTNNQQDQAFTASATEATYVSVNTTEECYVLLPTARIIVLDRYGVPQPCRAMLDSCSQRTLISEACVARLQKARSYDRRPLFGVGNGNSNHTRGKVDIQICTPEINISTKALCLSKLTHQHLPDRDITDERLSYFENLSMADPEYRKPGNIDIIIGADIYCDCFTGNNIKHPSGFPSAMHTIFGWVIIGKTLATPNSNAISAMVCLDLDKQMQRFWETEELPAKTQHLTNEEQQAEDHYKKHVQRNKQGQYIVKLPLKDNIVNLGESKSNALNRLYAMERRFNNNDHLRDEYKKFMNTYLELGHMEPATETKSDRVCFLPHHAVIKPSSSTTKLRVVYDASCKTSNGLSLNDNLLVGPVVQNDLFDIVLKFRKYEIGFTSDIEKMYRQVLVHPDDQSLQRIVWRNSPTEQPIEYNLKTVTYGTSAAPFLATRTLQQISEDYTKLYPNAADAIKQHFYVDDFMFCATDTKQAVELKDQISYILSSSGLHLRKWSSNSKEFLETINIEDREPAMVTYIDEAQTVNTLGLLWDTKSDAFKYNVKLLPVPDQLTKRMILSDIARIFDPMGWLSPVIVYMKIYMQKLWLNSKGWDDVLPTQLYTQWIQYRQKLDELSNLKIQRWLQFANEVDVELHGFSDSSELAYAAAIYIKVKRLDGTIHTNLVAAKTRVTPLKQVSLPRLELCAAALMAKLMLKVKQALNLQNVSVYGWTDSTVVLHWISDHPRRWKTFIANRTSQIIDVISAQYWRHIESKQNPADLATRGITPSDIIDNKLWWYGPQALMQKSNHCNPCLPAIPKNINLEERKEIITHTTIVSEIDIINRYSDLMKLVRITAQILRFANNCRNKLTKLTGMLNTTELQGAHDVLVRISQGATYHSEINILSKKGQLPSTNKLSSLTPFIDDKGLLRVGGRITNALVNYDQKHPIILEKNHALTKLIVSFYHIKYMHAGQRQLQYIIGLKYWIPSAFHIIKQCVYKCTSCMRQRGKPFQQQMGNLPTHRLEPGCAFINTGIDFAGPIQIRSWKGRGSKLYKCWIAIFVCLVTKAIHIELVTELSTAAFTASLRRFIARRGKPKNIYTDNGTNFVGCNQYLKDVYQFLNSQDTQNAIGNEINEQQIKWHFSPPSGPHFGGIWEAGVKSIKYHLRRVLKETSTTYEEMSTVLCQIEACLNSRPLCSKFEGDVDPLTPGHFIIMRPMAAAPCEDVMNVKETLLKRWQYLQRLVHQFWKKWSIEYISQLQQRPKWRQRLENIQVGDVVIIKDDNIPPTQWSMGRISELHPGADGLVRVVSVTTAKGSLKRPIVKLCPLFVDV